MKSLPQDIVEGDFEHICELYGQIPPYPKSSTIMLVLNDNCMPLDTIHWRQGYKRMFKPTVCRSCKGLGCWLCDEKGELPNAIAVQYYDIWMRSGGGKCHRLPAVLQNQHHVKQDLKKIPYSRRNVLRRDDYTCQYCGIQGGKYFNNRGRSVKLTVDHVVPRSMWTGKDTPTSWHNIVIACQRCNTKKANKTPEQAGMPLKRKVNGKTVFYKRPKAPQSIELTLGISIFDPKIPKEWDIYLEPIRKTKLR